MYKVVVSTTFDAAHRLENYNGPCVRLHGHTYTVTGEWERDSLDRLGMALDMIELKKHLRAVIVDMDHCFLNQIRDLAQTTAERLAQLLFKRLAKRVPSGEFLVAVTVEETPGCSVRYNLPHSPAPRLGVPPGSAIAPKTIEDKQAPESTDENANNDGPTYQEETT